MSMPNGSGGAGVLTRPPGLGGQDQHGLQASPEVLKSAELPLLLQPGGEQSALQFGDWLTLVAPLVGDISNPAREWWGEVLNETTALYDRWLTSTPSERIRLRAPEALRSEACLRLEQRIVPLLLKSIPRPGVQPSDECGWSDAAPVGAMSTWWQFGEHQHPALADGREHSYDGQ